MTLASFARGGTIDMMEGAHLYIVRCLDNSLYIGTTRGALELRIAEHNAGTYGGYTSTRRPVTLVYSEWFANIADAIAAERKLKKWTRAKKEAFISGDFEMLRSLSRRQGPHPSRRPPSQKAPAGSSG